MYSNRNISNSLSNSSSAADSQLNGFFNRRPERKEKKPKGRTGSPPPQRERHEPFIAPFVDFTEHLSDKDEMEGIIRYRKVFGQPPSEQVLEDGLRHCAKRIYNFVPMFVEGVEHTVWSPIKEKNGMCIWSLGIGRILKPHAGFSEWQSQKDLKRNEDKKKKDFIMEEKDVDVRAVREYEDTMSHGYNSEIAYDVSPLMDPRAMEKIFPNVVRSTRRPINTILGLDTCLVPTRNTSPHWPSLYGTRNRKTGVDDGIGNEIVADSRGRPKKIKIWSLEKRGMRDFANQPNYHLARYCTKIPRPGGKEKIKTVFVVCGFPIEPLFTRETIEYARKMMTVEVNLCFTGTSFPEDPKGDYLVLPPAYKFWFIVNVLHSASYEMFWLLQHNHIPDVHEYVDRSLTIFNYEMATSLACINGDPGLQQEFSKYASAFLQTPSSIHCNPSKDLRFSRITMNVLACLLIGHPRQMLVRPIMQALVAKMVFLIPQHRSADQQKLWFGEDGKGGIRAKWAELGEAKLNDYGSLWEALDVDDKDEMFVATRHLLDTVKGDLMVTICMLEYFSGRNPETMYNTLSSNFNQLPRKEMETLIAKMNVYRKRFDKRMKSKEDMGRMTIFIREALGWNAADPRSAESAILNWMEFLKLFAYMVVKFEPLRTQKPVLDETTQIRFSIDGTVYLHGRGPGDGKDEKDNEPEIAEALDPRVQALTQQLDQLRLQEVDVGQTIDVRLRKDIKARDLIQTKEKFLNVQRIPAYAIAEEKYQARLHNTSSPRLQQGATDIPLVNFGNVPCLFCHNQFGSTGEVIRHIKAVNRNHRKIFSEKKNEPTIGFTEEHHKDTCRNPNGWRCPACNTHSGNPYQHLWSGNPDTNECWGGQSSEDRRLAAEAKTAFDAEVAAITQTADQRVKDVDAKIAHIRARLEADVDSELKKIEEERKTLLAKIDFLDREAADRRRSEAEILKKREEERLLALEAKKKGYEEQRARLGEMVNLSFADQMIQSNCPVCTDDFKQDNVRLYIPCGHIGCEDCTDEWTEHCDDAGMDVTCPICRQIIQQTMPLPRL